MAPPPKISAAIVARSPSPERPAGLLADRALVRVAGKSVLEHIVRRLALCPNLGSIVLAAGDAAEDGRIIAAAEELGLPAVAGHPLDLLRRLRLAAESQGADHIVRVNGNFPLIDPWALGELIAGHLRKGADYSSNSHYQGLVYGLGAEVISVAVLKELVDYGLPADVHSGTRLFLRRPWDFNVNLAPAARTAPDLMACIDFPGDEKVAESIFARYPEPDNDQVITFFSDHPDLAHRHRGGLAAEVGLQKVLLFPEKLASLKENGPAGRDLTYPVSVELSLTNQCNQNCLWCSDRDLRQRCPDRMTPEILADLFSDLADGGTRGVTIEGGGEPTVSPYFTRAVASALDRDLAVGLITNGLDMFPPELPPNFYRRFEWIRISLDAADRWQYLKLKGVDGFDQVLAAIGRLAQLAPEVTLGVGYVLTNRNDEPDHLQNLVLTLRSLGVDYLQIRPVVDHPDLVSRLPLGFLKKFETSDFSVNLAALSENEPSGNQNLPCLAHSLSTVIGADGAVWLCGRLNTAPGAVPVGRLTETSFKDIWQGPERARQTAQAASAEFCRTHCPQCRMTKYNQLLADIDRLKTRNFI
ncbi:radical SAM protein [Deltaproteobacteria bacterium OttesenSCG-928-M10]|nr:radical SAM protein [Deltaproteobacteria bacterium OttesenSCG-928-M10]